MPDSHGAARAQLVEDRAIVWDSEEGSRLYAMGYYGQPVGIRKPKKPEFDKPLELSLLEAMYLSEKEMLIVFNPIEDKELHPSEIMELGVKRYDGFRDQYHVYRSLRDKGYVLRPGLKFGTDFAVYRKGPGKDHAPFLVHVVSHERGLDPLDIVRAGRLATSVRKKFIIATIKETGDIAYYSFVWFKP